MIGPFCYKDIANDEEFQDYLKKRINRYKFIIIVGVLTFMMTIFCLFFHFIFISEKIISYLIGISSGLIFGGILQISRDKKKLENEKLRRQERIQITDERSHTINDHALKTTIFIIIFELYIISIGAMLMNSDAYYICLFILISFLFIYLISFRIYSKKY